MTDAKLQAARPKTEDQLRKLATWLPVLTVFIVLGYAVAAWFFLFLPKIGPLMTGGKYDFGPIKDRIKADQAYVAKVKASLADYEKIPLADREKIKNMVPDTAYFPSIMAQMEQIAENNGMALSSINGQAITNMVSASGVVPIDIACTFEGGSQASFLTLLQDIEHLARIIDAQKVSTSSIGDTFQVVLRGYYLESSEGASTTAR